MNHQVVHPRDISSSEDNCRCEACKNQEQLKIYQRQNLNNILLHKHLKKRGGPPTKKDCFIKQFSQRAKNVTRKQQVDKKMQTQKPVEKPAATPMKQKLSEALKGKQLSSQNSFFSGCHPVSHSQREKVPSKQSNVIDQPRRVVNLQDIKFNGLNKDQRPKIASLRLVQISENPQNIKIRYNQSRSVSQASASCNNELQINEFAKSLQKIVKI